MSKELWTPTAASIENASITKLSRLISERIGADLSEYADLHQWSVDNIGEFWKQVWLDTEIVGEIGPHTYSEGQDFISSEFFPDARLNVAENLLHKGPDNSIAIVSILEDGSRREVTWKELRTLVAATASALRNEGVASGDRIVAWAPNVIEVIVFALAGLSIGAIISTSSPDFSVDAVCERFGQIEPKVLLGAKSYRYNGKVFDCTDRLWEISARLPTLIKIVLIADVPAEFPTFTNWIAPFSGARLTYTSLPFNHPGFVLFSSGTTGKPKCIIHSAAGVLLKVAAEYRYQLDLSENDRVFFHTTCGWMVWNWLFLVLSIGATIILYDGSPVSPSSSRLFDIAERERLTFMAVSAKLIDTVKKENLNPMLTHDLTALRILGSTGSVLAAESFDFIYSNVKSDVHLVSMSGGTDICGCFLTGVATRPVYRGELQGPCLGFAMDVFDDQGNSAEPGEKGELVCLRPFPSKPLGFWGDIDNQNYRSAYFEGFPGVWTHGDFATKTQSGGYILYGRSDATLNSKGIRIGTAEIYRIVESFNEISESMAVSQDWDGDTRVVLFVVMKGDSTLSDELVKSIQTSLRTQASPRHVPEKIIAAPELPRTKSNKLVELAVNDVINGRKVRNRDGVANPEALEWFKNLEELRH